MKLQSITIKKFRSIVKANNIALSNYTVLIGRNNEGKTNIISAIKMAFRYFAYYENGSLARINAIQFSRRYDKYDFQTDYPISYQHKDDKYLNNNPTVIELMFSLNEKEFLDFKKQTKLSLVGCITIQLIFTKNNQCEIWAKGRKKDPVNIKLILEFINKRLKPTIIPTIRTSRQSMDIIERIVQNDLDSLRNNEKYNEAYELIKEMEQKRLMEISHKLIPSLNNFLPNVKDVKIESGDYGEWHNFRRDLDLIIDDGVLTSIESKGDGIKSLVQMALLKDLSNNLGGLIIVEQPESHLHSGAIHELNEVLRTISKTQQVLVTTHNSIFVNGYNCKSNILVSQGECNPINNLMELRKMLGIEISDSLFASDFVILVEGSSDKMVLNHLLCNTNSKFKELVESNRIMFCETKGSSKSKSFMVLLKQLLIKYYCVWDNDAAGQVAYEEAEKNSLINNDNYSFIPKLDKNEVELEDMLNIDFVENIINSEYKIQIDRKKATKKKWSDRIKQNLINSGKIFTSKDEEEIKNIVANNVLKTNVNECVNPAYKDYIDNLSKSIISFFEFDY